MIKKLKKNLIVSFRYINLAYKIDKMYIFSLIFLSLTKSCISFINILMPKFIIDEMMLNQRIRILLLLVTITLVGNAVLWSLSNYFNYVIKAKNKKILNNFEMHLGENIMTMNFEQIEDPNILNLREKAIYPVKNQGVLEQMINSMAACIQHFITLSSLIVLISTLNIYVLLFLLLFVFVNICISHRNQKAEEEFITNIVEDNREMGYYRDLSQDFVAGKDIRLYSIQSLIISKIRAYINKSTTLFSRLMLKTGFWSGIANVNLQFQMSLIYGYITYEVIKKKITVGSYMMYINASINFCTAFYNFIQNMIQFQQMCKFLFPYKEFEEICSVHTLKKNGLVIKNKDNWCIEFKNVYFKYPHSNEYTLEDISIKIRPKEKLSIIGVNGAGKTTFIKLLCRLYEPTNGEITLNGTNITKYNYSEYINFINCIFQDFKLFAFSIAENIALDCKINNDKIQEVLNSVGLEQKIYSMEKSTNSSLSKLFDIDGIELSGGENQRLAIARALYRDSKIIIMDEPTAALDPVAESEIFNNLNEIAKNKTVIFISHRLSSCKFCDNIAVFDKGHIIQYGSHDELISDCDGKYFELFTKQSRYYNEV